MAHCYEMWPVIEQRLRKAAWTPLEEIYRVVETSFSLDAEDWMPAAPGSRDVRWRRNVRNVLPQRRGIAEVQLRRPALYRLS